jgi:hypothetical protein
MAEIFDNDLNDYLTEKENECSECGTPIDEDKLYCSSDCFKTSMI